jgi:tetratricopeptide (TPR) repeat protein
MTRTFAMLTILCVLVGCQTAHDGQTISQLRNVEPDLKEVPADDSLIKAMAGYRQFLNATPGHAMAPEAMRRLADLEIEKDYGVIGKSGVIELPAPDDAANGTGPVAITGKAVAPAAAQDTAPVRETDAAFEDRTTARSNALLGEKLSAAELPEGAPIDLSGPRQAIQTYQKILVDYPWYERNDQVLYQMARAYDELSEPDEAMRVIDRLTAEYPNSKYLDEVYFRRGEFQFVRRKFRAAEDAYQAVVSMGESSSFYELALYKLGWSLYKQDQYEEALRQYIALLDYKLSKGYDFDATAVRAGSDEEEGDERRVIDTFHVISLSFVNLGGPEVLNEYFKSHGSRSYEDRIYRNLAEFHLEKRRYADAVHVYQAFVELYPFHKVSPHFSMRVADIYKEGDFPLLIVEAKRDFAKRYGIHAEYWQHFDIESMPDVRDYLKSDLMDLANHFHALYQRKDLEEDRPNNYVEALKWYREFLDSFPQDATSPTINYQLADLLLEHRDFGASALEYERTAYGYPTHERSSAAGYAAIYAHREDLKVVAEADAAAAKLATVESSLKFAQTFPEHEHAAAVLGAATEDLYAMRDFERAITSGQWLLDKYPGAETSLRRTAWLIVAHSSLELARYPESEHAYTEALAIMDPQDSERQSIVDNLAASIYKQGEQARAAEDYAAAAEHFLRIKSAAPGSQICASAEYDAAAALIHLQQWNRAAEVLEDFRSTYPDHALRPEATRQLADVYEKAGNLSRSASEYERVAVDAGDPEMRRQAILVAADLYEKAAATDDTVRVYRQYIGEFPRPIDAGLEVRFKLAEIYKARNDQLAYREQLTAIVDIDGKAGAERSDRSRTLAAKSSLVLTVPLFDEFKSLALTQPFEQSLTEKRRRMDVALAAFDKLVSYEVGEVTAAATYYMAEIYRNLSDAMLASERPAGLSTAERSDYEAAIEEEAQPFEDRSIAVHQKNVELIGVGVYNQWVQRSLDELAELVPGRYAKQEISGGFMESIEQYTYRTPVAPVFAAPAAGDGGAGTVAPATEPPAPAEQAQSPVKPDPNDLAGVADVATPH